MVIRTMTRGDLTGARRLQLAEGWNQTPEDWDLFLAQNPEGCLVAVSPGRPPDEEVIGTITSIRYGSEVCWISMLLVHSDFRNAGIGSRLMRDAIAANERACRCLRLDATPAGRPVYEQLGFHADCDIERWVCKRRPTDLSSAPQKCEPITEASLDSLCARDLEVFGADRSPVIRRLFHGNEDGSRVCGTEESRTSYVLGRRGESHYHIGPVVAADRSDARELLAGGLSSAGDMSAVADLISPSAETEYDMESLGFVKQRPFTRMSRGSGPPVLHHDAIAIAGPEFG